MKGTTSEVVVNIVYDGIEAVDGHWLCVGSKSPLEAIVYDSMNLRTVQVSILNQVRRLFGNIDVNVTCAELATMQSNSID